MADWQPIDTAPQDGTWILVPYPIWLKGNDTPTPSEFKIIRVQWNGRMWDNGGWALHEKPKVWQPLPTPPDVSTWYFLSETRETPMTERKKIVFGGGRRQGKTERLREETKAAIEAGKQIYLPSAPSIADEAPLSDDPGQASKHP